MSKEIADKETAPPVSFDNLFGEDNSNAPIEVEPEAKPKAKAKKPKAEAQPEQEEIEELEHTQEEKQEKREAKPESDVEDIEKIKKRLSDSQSWARKIKQEYSYSKKTISNILKNFVEDGKIFEEDMQEALKAFDAQIEPEQEAAASQTQAEHPFVALKNNLDKEFAAFKKYAKVKDADEKYNSFFSFLAWDTPKEQEKFMALMEEGDTADIIEHVMSEGAELYEHLYKGIHKDGGLRHYAGNLNSRVKELEAENKRLKEELDTNTGIVYSKSINSRAAYQQPTKATNNRFDELF